MGRDMQPSLHNEDECKFVSTVGLSLICDQKPKYFRRQVEYGWNFNNQPGDIVFVKSTHLMALANYLPNFVHPIIIVTNGDDGYFPYDFQKQPNFDRFLGPHVLHIFAQNCWLKDHPKFHGIPIGIDYHTLNWEHSTQHDWGRANGVTALQQEDILLKCISKPFNESDPTSIITNFHLAMNDPPRRQIMRQGIYKHLKDVEWMKWLPKQTREEFWNECDKVSFVLCPPGNGPDTHRAWEVLMLGRVPIIQDLSINQVYDGLPVWIVKDWQEFAKLSTEDLVSKQKEFASKWSSYKWEKLTLKYWSEYIHSFKQKA